MKYEELKEAKEILGLGDYVTLDEIKSKYRKLCKKYHPDTCDEDKAKCAEMFRKVDRAYKIIMEYCKNYRFSLKDEDLKKSSYDEDWWFRHFGKDPHWSDSF